MENELPNYFVLNKYSELWEVDTFFGDKDFVSLTPSSSFSLKNTIDIPLRLSVDNNSTRADSASIYSDSLFSLDLDRHNMLYILEKDTKKIRRLSVDRYEQYGTTNTDKLIFDEYITACKGLEEPQSLEVTDRHIYVLDNSILHVLSKVDSNLIKSLKFRDRINLFKLTEDEDILFYSYSNDKSVIYKKNLVWDYEPSEEQRDSDQDIRMTGISKSSDYHYTDNEVSENVIDIAINNKLEILYILTHESLYSYYYGGESRQFAYPIRLGDNVGDEFSPTSLAIDEESNDIFIGNTTEGNATAFPRKLTFSKDTGQKTEGKLEKIEVESQSQKIFLSKAVTSYRRLLIFNFVPKRDRNER